MAGNTENLDAVKVDIQNVRRVFHGSSGDVVALDGVSLQMRENEFVCVVGPSGCGKTTLLNILSGLDKQDEGVVMVDGKEIRGPSAERGVVFQQYALFPWLTVRKNVEFGLKNKKLPKDEIKRISDHYINMVGLSDFASSFPKELSGGMKQRVAIARAYAMNPSLLLLDEPFGALDAQTRTQLQLDLITTWMSERKTCFFITHDVDEAVLLSRRVVVMSARPGRIKKIVDIDLPYPRTQEIRMSREFAELRNIIWAEVYNEYLAQKQ